VLAIVFGAIIAIPSTLEVPNWIEAMASCMVVYYMLFIVIFIVGATGFCVSTFRKYGVNYSYIFELEIGGSGLMQHQLYIIALKMLFIWFVCLNLQAIFFKFGIRVFSYPVRHVTDGVLKQKTGDGSITALCVLIFLGLVFNPYHLY